MWNVRKKSLNNRGDVLFISIILIVISMFLAIIAGESGSQYNKSYEVKAHLNRAIKAAANSIKTGDELAHGEFLIDETLSRRNFNKVICASLGLNETTLQPNSGNGYIGSFQVLEFKVINNVPNTFYSSVLNKTYTLKYPSVYAVIKYTNPGAVGKEIILATISGGELTSKYN